MNRNSRTLLMISTAVIAFGAAPTAAEAQVENSASGRVNDIITVTARKKEETTQDAPLAVSAVSGAQLDRAGIDSFDQVLNVIPNASQPGGIAGGLQGLISIRGISTLVRFVGLETGVGFYVDGVYAGRPESFNQDLIDIERIEVLRGPQGAVFGKNTIAGAINIITETPDNELRARAEVQYGNFNHVKFRSHLSGPLIEDRLYASVSGGVTRRDGFVENAFPGGVDLDDADLSTARAKLRFTPNDRAEFILSGDLLIDRGNASFFEVADVAFVDDPSEATPFTVNADQENFLHRDIYGASLISNIDIGPGTWTTVLGYRDTSFDAQLDDDKLPVRFFADAFSSDTEFFSAETRYAARLGERIDYVIGAYYFTQDASNLSNFALGDFLTGVPGVEPPLDLTSSVETDSFAFFINTDIAITERLSLELGGRYINEKKDAIHNQVDGTGLFGDVAFDISRRDTDFSPTISLSYDLTGTSTVYGRFAQGFKSAGFNTDIISAAANQEVDPESATSYEIGHKATWADGLLNTNAAIFYTTYDDLQVATITSAAVSLENAARAEIFGVEFDFAAALGQYFDLNGSVGYLDATYDDFAGCPAGGAIPVAPLSNCAGNFLNNAPEFTAALGAQFTYPVNDKLGNFVARADWNYRSEIFFEPQNEVRLSGDSRNLLDVRAGFAADNWEIFGWARNVTNETYVNFADDRSAIFVNTTQAFGPPRTYGVTLRLKY